MRGTKKDGLVNKVEEGYTGIYQAFNWIGVGKETASPRRGSGPKLQAFDYVGNGYHHKEYDPAQLYFSEPGANYRVSMT